MRGPNPRTAPIAPAATDPKVDSIPWVTEGIAAGVLGAGVIALFFAVLDLAQGQLFWTPFVLGSALLLDRVPEPGSAIVPGLVFAYTAFHGVVFTWLGLLTAFQLLSGKLRSGPFATRVVILAAILFVAVEVTFLGFWSLLAPGALALLGIGRIAFANALGAAAMAGLLCTLSSRWLARETDR